MSASNGIAEYQYSDATTGHHHRYLLEKILPIIKRERANNSDPRVFDLGCGNGSASALIAAEGFDVSGVDPSIDGIRHANVTYPNLKLQVGSAYDDLASKFGTFPIVVSLEVIEHLYDPRQFVQTVRSLLQPRGLAIISTPYHGYFKNVALALSGKMDAHFTALWDHGHIKFWSPGTLSQLLTEADFRIEAVIRAGRVPVLAKSMIVCARPKPAV